VGFIGPALPWIAKGASILGGALAGKKAQSSAMQRSPEELAALQGAQQAAGGLQTAGQQFLGMGRPWLGQAGNYYQTLLGGSRGAMQQAVAGPTAAITDVYRGAERGLERSGVRGAARDVASGEINRQRASQVAGLYTGMQPSAAAALASLGGSTAGLGADLAGQAGSIYGGLLGQGAANRAYGRAEGEKFGSSIGGLIFDVISGTWKKKPSAPGVPGWSPGPF